MARTIHHTVWRRLGAYRHDRHLGMPCEGLGWDPNCTYAGPLNDLHDLRYSTGEVEAAAREGRRPRPAHILRTVQHSSYVALHTDNIGEYCNTRERAARTATRDRLRAATAYANSVLSGGDWDAFDDEQFDVVPTRHRGSARWDVW